MPEEYQRKTTSYPTGQYPYAADHKDRRYPTYGEFLMENPFAKKKKKKKGKKKKKWSCINIIYLLAEKRTTSIAQLFQTKHQQQLTRSLQEFD